MSDLWSGPLEAEEVSVVEMRACQANQSQSLRTVLLQCAVTFLGRCMPSYFFPLEALVFQEVNIKKD